MGNAGNIGNKERDPGIKKSKARNNNGIANGNGKPERKRNWKERNGIENENGMNKTKTEPATEATPCPAKVHPSRK